MNKALFGLPFKIGAPSMVFGKDLLKNVRRLAGVVDNIEIVLFFTPDLHNFPSDKDIQALKAIQSRENLTFTIHLPASLEIASRVKRKRAESVQMALDLCQKMAEINPLYTILHIPFSPPTLVPVPGLYFSSENRQQWDGWTQRALESLEIIHGLMEQPQTLLIENINYSPSYLEPFFKTGFCYFCLDLGHLMLGGEDVVDILEQYLTITREIHIHGVIGYDEHLSLSVVPENEVLKWLRCLTRNGFNGVINFEVFSPADLETSIKVFYDSLRSL
jgi:sugar phosphate isomerase/epimerase